MDRRHRNDDNGFNRRDAFEQAASLSKAIKGFSRMGVTINAEQDLRLDLTEAVDQAFKAKIR